MFRMIFPIDCLKLVWGYFIFWFKFSVAAIMGIALLDNRSDKLILQTERLTAQFNILCIQL